MLLQVVGPVGGRPLALGAQRLVEAVGLQVDDALEFLLRRAEGFLCLLGLLGVVVLPRLRQGRDLLPVRIEQLDLEVGQQARREAARPEAQFERAGLD
jgi:uncharacterized membrane protein